MATQTTFNMDFYLQPQMPEGDWVCSFCNTIAEEDAIKRSLNGTRIPRSLAGQFYDNALFKNVHAICAIAYKKLNLSVPDDASNGVGDLLREDPNSDGYTEVPVKSNLNYTSRKFAIQQIFRDDKDVQEKIRKMNARIFATRGTSREFFENLHTKQELRDRFFPQESPDEN